MTPVQALLALVVGLGMAATAVVWLFGPWALLATGMVLALAALLLPTREPSPPPPPDDAPTT